jgi:hypothetical protein
VLSAKSNRYEISISGTIEGLPDLTTEQRQHWQEMTHRADEEVEGMRTEWQIQRSAKCEAKDVQNEAQ